MESPGSWESPGLYCCSSHIYFCCLHKPHASGVTAAPSQRNLVMPMSRICSYLHPQQTKLPTLTLLLLCAASLTSSPHSQWPLASLYRQYKLHNMKPHCLGAKKIVDPPGTEESAQTPAEASALISQMTNLWLLETAFLGIKQFPNSSSFKVIAALFKVIFL